MTDADRLTPEQIFERTADRTLSVDDALALLLSDGDSVSTGGGSNIVHNPQVICVREFSYDEPLVRDHLLFGERVVLGTACCSMAIEGAMSRHVGAQAGVIRNFFFDKPIIVKLREPVRVAVRLEEGAADGAFQPFAVHQRLNGEAEQLAARGELAVHETASGLPGRVDLGKLHKRLDKKICQADVYGALPIESVLIGQTLRTIVSIACRGKETLTRLSPVNPSFGARFDPTLLNGAIMGGVFGSSTATSCSYVPMLIKRVRWWDQLTSACWAHTKVRKQNTELLIVDIELCDEDGRVRLAMDGVTLKRLRRDGLDASARARPAAILESKTDRAGVAPSAELGDLVSQHLKRCIAQALGTDNANFADLRNFMDLGLDSAALVTLARNLEQTLGAELFPTLFFEHQNISELTNYLLEHHANAVAEFFNKRSARTIEPSSRSAVGPTQRNHDLPQRIKPVDRQNPIAIIGMSGRFGGCRNLEEFWANLASGKNLISEIPLDHFDYRPWFVPGEKCDGKTYCKWGSFISDVDKFDAAFFNISPREAQVMDPQARLLLETFVHTANDAGYGKRIFGTDTGVYVGACFYDYKQEMDRVGKAMGPHDGIGNSPTMMSNRPSFFFDLKGPSLTVDTSCSSSLVALDLAVQALRRGDCEMAFVGAVNLLLCSWHYRYFCSIEALSYTGRCHSFDTRADGYVPGEAVVAVLLKPLDQALRDNDRIHAVIKGTAVNHGGRTQSITAPSIKQEAEVIGAAWQDAGITAETIGYIEAHGTGTRLGDPIEIDALKRCFGQSDSGEKHCAIGSAKAHLGHTEGAAGLTGVIKAVLSLQRQTIPAMPNFTELNEFVRLDDSPLYINRKTQTWPRPRQGGRTAGVSSFGFGGTYAHVVVQEFEAPSGEEPAADQDFIFALSAKDRDRLKDCCSRLVEFLRSSRDRARSDGRPMSPPSLSRIEATLLLGREEMNYRVAVLARTEHELIARLSAFLAGSADPATTFASQTPADEREGHGSRPAMISRRRIADLAASWVRGARIDWQALYQDKPPPPISLFEYPFARQRHWFESSATQSTVSERPKDQEAGRTAGAGGQTYAPCAIASELVNPAKGPQKIGRLLAFTVSGPLEERLVTWAAVNGTKLVLVNPGERFRRVNPGRFEISARTGDGYFELCRTLSDEGAAFTHVLHAWMLDQRAGEAASHLPETSDASSDALRTWGVYSVFHIIKALGDGCGGLKRFLYGFRDERGAEAPELEAISGYGKSLAAVRPRLLFSVVRFPSDAGSDEILEAVQRELVAPSVQAASEVAYQNGRRYLRSVKRISLPVAGPTQSVLRAGDTVLLTGGAGKLGRIFARHLLVRYGANVALMGRSALAEPSFESGSNDNVVYLRGDVGNRDQVKAALNAIQYRFGRLDAVIHAAGAIPTVPIDKQSFAEFQGGLKAKIDGLINVDEETKHERLRFFMIFSSVSSILGDFGQCNYAVSNRFCDSYGELRQRLYAAGERHGRTIVVNWPLWRLENAHDARAEELYLKSGGLAYLDPDRGCELFDAVLAADHGQIIHLEGDGERIDKLMSALSAPPSERTADAFVEESAALQPGMGSLPADDLLGALRRQITSVLAGLLSVEERSVPLDAKLVELGVDSIILKEFAAKLGDLFKTKFPPNIIFNYPSIIDLSRYLFNQFQDKTTAIRAEEQTLHLSNCVGKPASRLCSIAPPATSVISERRRTADGIAIIGMSMRFPGANDADEFWRVLEDKRIVVREIPIERWDAKASYDGSAVKPHRSISKWGGLLDGVAEFDAEFFNISPAEAEVMDPQHRLFLETAWRALEDSGHAPSQLAGGRVGVFAGVQFNDYQTLIREVGEFRPQIGTGNSHAMLANRVSFLLDLKGPSETIDTACSSSLVAVHRAVRSLIDEECELALVGGVSVITNAEQYIVASQLGVLSPDGRCRPFDEHANGFVKGEGAGVLVLKPLARALADRDHVYAVIQGTAVNHGGRASSLTAPDAAAQAQVIQAAVTRAGIDANTIGYIETHGTGTELGDPIEIEGLNRAFDGLGVRATARCAIGSVKANIGHLEAASGIAGLIKTALALTKIKIPGTPSFARLNPHILLGERFFVAADTMAWPSPQEPDGCSPSYRAGVSAFGFGGSNAHVVLEQYADLAAEAGMPATPVPDERPELVILSAKAPDRLREYARNLAEWCAARSISGANPSISDIAFTLQAGRDEMVERLAIVAANMTELRQALSDYEDAVENPSVYRGAAKGQSAVERQRFVGVETTAAYSTSARLIEARDWHALAKAWVGGAPVDWNLVRRPAPARRLSLPAYPFARTRYWITDRRALALPHTAENSGRGIAVSRVDDETFVAKLSGSLPFIADHVIGGRRILSAAAHLEIARQVGEVYRQSAVRHICDVVWIKPVVLKGETIDLFVRITPAADHLEFETSPEPKFGPDAFSRGVLRFSIDLRSPPLGIFDSQTMERVRSSCRTVRSMEECYRALAAAGYEFGPSYRTIRELRCNERYVVADLADPTPTSPAFVLRPHLLDGAFQAIIAPSLSQPSDSLLLPYAIDEVSIAAPISAECSSYLTLQPCSPGIRPGFRKADITVVNQDGCVAVVITGLSFKGDAAPDTGYEGRPQAEMIGLLRKIIADETRLPLEAVTASKPFEGFGIDSVMILSLTRKLEEQFGRLSKTLLFEHRNIDQLAPYLANLVSGRGPSSKQTDVRCSLSSDTARHDADPDPNPDADAEPDADGTSSRFGNSFIGVPAARRRATLHQIEPDEAIAVIGLSGRYPMAADLDAFWKNLTAGRDCVTEIPKSRWDHDKVFSPDKGRLGTTYGKWGAFLDDVEMFDADLFNIAPRDAVWIDPQERLFLEVAWQTLEDAGYTRKALSGRRVGVFVGVMYGHYQLLGAEIDGRTMHPGVSYASIANRVSFSFDLTGPSIALDTMCSSSLTAIKLACDSLRNNESELALAGGVNVTIHPSKYTFLSQGRYLASDGRCRAFGSGGDGYVPGEGVGAALLKPLARALSDGDHIYGVIRAIAVNHGGRTHGYTVPNPDAQRAVISAARGQAQVHPRSISFIEAHGTGTALGDPIEISALAKAFGDFTGEKQFCAIGSVKSNIGHLESAAGIAALTKVLLQMKHKTLVPTLHAEKINPHIDFEQSPFFLQRDCRPWHRPTIEIEGRLRTMPRRAGISSFGAGGSNAHLLVDEYQARQEPLLPAQEHLIVLSARTKPMLRQAAERLLQFIRQSVGAESANDAAPEAISSEIRKTIASLLSVSESEIGVDSNLIDCGIEADHLVSLAAALSAQFDIELSAASFSGANSVRAMAGVIACSVHNAGLQGQFRVEERRERNQLAKIAFTLQVGREPGRERVAWAVTSTDELERALSRFCSGAASAPDDTRCYCGTVDESSRHSPIVLDDRSSELNDRVARAWVSGVEVDWMSRYPAGVPGRISLPASPLMHRRYWVEPAPQAPAAVAQSEPVAAVGVHNGNGPLRERLKASLATILAMNASELDAHRPFEELGMTSVAAVEWISRVNEEFAVAIRPTAVYDHPTLDEFTRHLEILCRADASVSADAPRDRHATSGYPTRAPGIAEILEQIQTGEIGFDDAEQFLAVSLLQDGRS